MAEEVPIVKLFDLKYDLDECLADIHRGIDRIDTAISICNSILMNIQPAKLSMPATTSVIEVMVKAILAGLDPKSVEPESEVEE
jgi:hypothetical protein